MLLEDDLANAKCDCCSFSIIAANDSVVEVLSLERASNMEEGMVGLGFVSRCCFVFVKVLENV